jgi:glycerol uptake facilitator protein
VNPAVVAEFFGTLILILLGDGVVAGTLLAKSKAHNAGWIVVTAGWAFGVTCGMFVSLALGGPGSLNPVGPLIEIVVNGEPVAANLALIAAQFLGAFCGGVLVWLHYLPHWKETPDPAAKLGVFCTAPGIRSPLANLFSEALATFVLVIVAGAMLAQAEDSPFSPTLVGLVVWAIGLSLGGTTGYAINPARDLGPRLAHAVLPIAGKGSSDWSYAWIPIVGPCLGALAGAWMFSTLAK